MSGMEGGMLEGGGGGLDNQMGRLTLSSEDLSNKNRENGSPYDNKVGILIFFTFIAVNDNKLPYITGF
jgi:hypothetical protein